MHRIQKDSVKTMEEIVFHHTLPIQLRFNNVDKFDHVNNTVYFSFYGLGQTEYFASVCPGVDTKQAKPASPKKFYLDSCQLYNRKYLFLHFITKA